MEEEVTFTMSTIITDIGSLVTGAASWIGTTVDAISDEPLLLFFVLAGFIGVGIGLIRRIIG